MVSYDSISGFTETMEKLAENYLDERWLSSIALPLKQLPAKQKGKFMELLTRQLLQAKGYSISNRINVDHDFVMNGLKVELKGSTEVNKSHREFSILQIRPSDDYDILMMALYAPEGLSICTLTKADISALIQNRYKGFDRQHGGANKGDSYTWQFHGDPCTIPECKIIV